MDEDSILDVPVPPNHGLLAVMDKTGDTKIMWDVNNADEIAVAKKSFDDLKAKGYLAYATDKEGNKREQIHTFDPKAERIILSPPMRGG